ncbi:MAG: DUF3179 domain-containing protein [Pseudomonadota bacterium]
MLFRRLAFAAGFTFTVGFAHADPSFWKFEWPNTDFETTTIGNWVEIMSGGPPKDGIPAIDEPRFIPVSDEAGLQGAEAVVAVELKGERPRAYPVRYLMWHEIVNDQIGATPVSVTYCPLCNSFMVFDTRVGDRVLTFGVSGKLRNSDMVMYDRQTESWWQQAIGAGIVGEMTGTELTLLPTWMESWQEFSVRNPDGLVMAQPEFPRRYGANPYLGYDTSSRPFLYNGEMPPHDIPPLMRVIRVGDKAWTMARLREAGELTEAGVTISWAAGKASSLDQQNVAEGRDVGSIRVRDSAGNDVPHDVLFAFAFHAFWPDGTWMLGG